MLRAVLDPGVLIAAIISSKGAPAHLLLLWLEGAFELFASPQLLEELRQVLLRDKFRRYASSEEAEAYLQTINRLAIVVEDPNDIPRVSKDPGDDYLVALASSVSAILVSGDPHLTKLEVEAPQIMTPREFADSLA